VQKGSDGNIWIMLHSGSRNFGLQIAKYYNDLAIQLNEKWHSIIPKEWELAFLPIDSNEGQAYLKEMDYAVQFAYKNRMMMMERIKVVLVSVAHDMDLKEISFEPMINIAHNYAALEHHFGKDVYVHRKGATRCFPAGHKEVPEAYRSVGHPVLIPGSMGTASYVLVGAEHTMDIAFGSTAHGAGRVCSRTAALQNLRGEHVKNELAKRGIEVKAVSWKTLAEEAPEVYKDIDEVVKVSHEVGIGNLVVRVVPLSVMKG
jgi:tRNA-splicing ligase RtcB